MTYWKTKEVSHLYYLYFVSIYPVYPVLDFVFCFKSLQTAMRKNLMILNDYPVVFRDWNCRPDFVHMGMSENSVPLNPMVLLIIIPMKNGYFIGNINPTFSDKPIWDGLTSSIIQPELQETMGVN